MLLGPGSLEPRFQIAAIVSRSLKSCKLARDGDITRCIRCFTYPTVCRELSDKYIAIISASRSRNVKLLSF